MLYLEINSLKISHKFLLIFEAVLFFYRGKKNDHEFLVVGGIWGVVTGGTGPRPCLAPDGGNTVGGGGDGEGTPTTSPAPVIKKYRYII